MGMRVILPSRRLTTGRGCFTLTVERVTPSVAAAQAWRGRPQHQISRVLKACHILPDDQATGRAAGIACAASGTPTSPARLSS
jgi:hypothetical protein